MTEHPCDRCTEMPARFYRERHAVCEHCSARMDARALINAAWQATTRRERRTYADMIRAWEAR